MNADIQKRASKVLLLMEKIGFFALGKSKNVFYVLAKFGSNQFVFQLTSTTSSSVVTKRPRNASCLSVVSFNSTKRRAHSFIVSYVGYRFISACN